MKKKFSDVKKMKQIFHSISKFFLNLITFPFILNTIIEKIIENKNLISGLIVQQQQLREQQISLFSELSIQQQQVREQQISLFSDFSIQQQQFSEQQTAKIYECFIQQQQFSEQQTGKISEWFIQQQQFSEQQTGKISEWFTQQQQFSEQQTDKISEWFIQQQQLREQQTAEILCDLSVQNLKKNGIITTIDNLVIIMIDNNIIAYPGEEWRLAAYQYFRGNLEPGLTILLKKIIRFGMTFIDIGANIGHYSLMAANIVGEKGRVLSFEPTPRTFLILKNNIQVNGYLENRRIIPYQMAITDGKTEKTKFCVYSNNLSHNSIYSLMDEGCEEIEVPCSSLDSILQIGETVDIIKVDAEGSEPFILEGMRRIISENLNTIIIIEFVPTFIIKTGYSVEGIIALIESYNFTFYKIDDNTGNLSYIGIEELKDSYTLNLLLKHINNHSLDDFIVNNYT